MGVINMQTDRQTDKQTDKQTDSSHVHVCQQYIQFVRVGLGLGFGLENKEGTTKQTWTSLTNRQTDRLTDRQTNLIEWYLLLHLNSMLHCAVNIVSKMLTHLRILRK